MTLLWVVAGVAVGLSCIQHSLSRGLADVCGALVQGLATLAGSVRTWREARLRALSDLLDAEGLRYEGRWRWSYAISSIVIAVACVLFMIVDWEVVVLALSALGLLGEGQPARLGIDPGLLTGLGIVGPLLMCAWLLGELWGYPRFLPAGRYGHGEKLFWRALCAAACAISFAAVPFINLFRLEAERQNVALERLTVVAMAAASDPSPSTSEPAVELKAFDESPTRDRATLVALVLIPTAVTLAAVVTWHFGVAAGLQLLTPAILAVLCFLLHPIEGALRLLRAAVDLSYRVAFHLIALLSKLATIPLRLLVTPTRLAADWAEESLRLGGPGMSPSARTKAILVLTLTSWSRDLEIPTEPLGNRTALDETQPANDTPAEPAAGPTIEPAGDAGDLDSETPASTSPPPSQPSNPFAREDVDANWDPYRN